MVFPSRKREGLGVGRAAGSLAASPSLPTPCPTRLREGRENTYARKTFRRRRKASGRRSCAPD